MPKVTRAAELRGSPCSKVPRLLQASGSLGSIKDKQNKKTLDSGFRRKDEKKWLVSFIVENPVRVG